MPNPERKFNPAQRQETETPAVAANPALEGIDGGNATPRPEATAATILPVEGEVVDTSDAPTDPDKASPKPAANFDDAPTVVIEGRVNPATQTFERSTAAVDDWIGAGIMPRGETKPRAPWDEQPPADPALEKALSAARNLLNRGWEALRRRLPESDKPGETTPAGEEIAKGKVGLLALRSFTSEMWGSLTDKINKALGKKVE